MQDNFQQAKELLASQIRSSEGTTLGRPSVLTSVTVTPKPSAREPCSVQFLVLFNAR